MLTTARKGLPLVFITDAAAASISTGRGTTTSGVVRDSIRTIATIADFFTDFDKDEVISGRWEFGGPVITDKGIGQLFVNNTGGVRASGDVVMVDPAIDSSIILPTAGASGGKIGVVTETIAASAVGHVAFAGFIRVKVAGGVGRSSFLQAQSGTIIAAGSALPSSGTFAIAVTNADGVPSVLACLGGYASLEGGGTVTGNLAVSGAITATSVSATTLVGALSTASQPALVLAESQITNLVADLALRAPLLSPAFTGVPVAPTAAGGTSTTQIATTAFVAAGLAALSAGITSIAIAGTTDQVLVNGGIASVNTGTATLSLPASVTISGALTAGTLVGTITTAAQPNITSLGTLTGQVLVDPVITGQVNIGTGVQALPTATGNTGKWRYYKASATSQTITPFTGQALWAPGEAAARAANATYVSPAGESTDWYCNGTNWVCI